LSYDLKLLTGADREVIRGPWNLPVTYAARISVKRVFRGDKDRFKSGSIILEGLGNPKICVSRPKIGDTRIFFADPIEFEEFNFPAENRTHFRLRSSILRLTLENLKFLWNDEKMRAANLSTTSGRNELFFTFGYYPRRPLITELKCCARHMKFWTLGSNA